MSRWLRPLRGGGARVSSPSYQAGPDVQQGGEWPVTLCDAAADPLVTLRPLRRADETAWRDLRTRSAEHVRPWEPTLPPGAPKGTTRSFAEFVDSLDAEGRAGTLLPWALCVGSAADVVGQVHVFSIVRGSQQSGAVGYWIGPHHARQGITTRAVALAIDHALGPAGLHRVEVNVRVDNCASLALVARLGLREEGVRQRFLHIDGEWRDHRSFAITADELANQPLLQRVSHR